MSFRILLLLLALAMLLAGAVYVSFTMWTTVGGGLMALMFFSSRRGYDDAADLKSRDLQDR